MIPRPVLTKIPGELPKIKENHVEDLGKISKIQLLELRDRQTKLLANKGRVSKLPDKGKRIQDLFERIEKELASRDEIEKAAVMFSEFNITSTGQKKLSHLEWTGRTEKDDSEMAVVDSDDEEEPVDPLKIIAQSRGVRTVKILKPEKSLITEEDLKEISEFQEEKNTSTSIADKIETSGEEKDKTKIVPAEIVEVDVKTKLALIKNVLMPTTSSSNTSHDPVELEPHTLYLCGKEQTGLETKKEKFLPNRTTKTDVHSVEKERATVLKKNWENTAATPPPIRHSAAQLLNLHDSVQLQMEYLERMKIFQQKQAEERLSAKLARQIVAPVLPDATVRKLNQFFTSYRDAPESDSESETEPHHMDSDEGVRDDEGENKGGVVFTVFK